MLTAPRPSKMITLKTAVLRWRPMQHMVKGHRNVIHLTPCARRVVEHRRQSQALERRRDAGAAKVTAARSMWHAEVPEGAHPGRPSALERRAVMTMKPQARSHQLSREHKRKAPTSGGSILPRQLARPESTSFGGARSQDAHFSGPDPETPTFRVPIPGRSNRPRSPDGAQNALILGHPLLGPRSPDTYF